MARNSEVFRTVFHFPVQEKAYIIAKFLQIMPINLKEFKKRDHQKIIHTFNLRKIDNEVGWNFLYFS